MNENDSTWAGTEGRWGVVGSVSVGSGPEEAGSDKAEGVSISIADQPVAVLT